MKLAVVVGILVSAVIALGYRAGRSTCREQVTASVRALEVAGDGLRSGRLGLEMCIHEVDKIRVALGLARGGTGGGEPSR